MSDRDAILEEAARVAALFIINRNSIHPDIAFDDIAPNTRMIAHTTCQYVAEAIRALKSLPTPQDQIG